MHFYYFIAGDCVFFSLMNTCNRYWAKDILKNVIEYYYPNDIKAFYMRRNDDNRAATATNLDLGLFFFFQRFDVSTCIALGRRRGVL